MSTGYSIDRQDAVYYLTFQVVDWIDLFSRQVYRDLFLESLRYCQEHKALEVYAFVFMSNHVHFALNADGQKRNECYQLWTHENHAEEIYSNRFVDQKIAYIHQNPVRAGLVKRAEDYLYSSASNYAGEVGVLKVVVIRPSVTGLRLYRTIR